MWKWDTGWWDNHKIAVARNKNNHKIAAMRSNGNHKKSGREAVHNSVPIKHTILFLPALSSLAEDVWAQTPKQTNALFSNIIIITNICLQYQSDIQ